MYSQTGKSVSVSSGYGGGCNLLQFVNKTLAPRIAIFLEFRSQINIVLHLFQSSHAWNK